MASSSGRRYGSSGGSRKRRSVYITGRGQDRALSELRDHAARESKDEPPSRGTSKRGRPRRGATAPREDEGEQTRSGSAAQRAAEQKRTERETRRTALSRATRIRAASVAAILVLVVGGCWALYRSPVFKVTRVEVEGTSNLSEQRVLALANVPQDATLVRFPADAVAERVGADPWVAYVTVSRLFPNGMRIRVVERAPIAMVDAGTMFWLIDRSGMIIARRSAEQTATLIVIRDVPGLDPKAGRRTSSEPLLNAVRVLTGLSDEIVSQVKSVSAPTVDGTTLYTQDRVEIVIGQAAELSKKDDLVLTILREQRGKVVSIDVRTTDRPTWRGLPR